MDWPTFTKVVRAGTPFDTGEMMNSWLFYDTPYYYLAVADVGRIPYFVYNEKGTIYTKKNKGFISKGIVGQINNIEYSETLGLPYSIEGVNKKLESRNNELLLSMGVMEVL